MLVLVLVFKKLVEVILEILQLFIRNGLVNTEVVCVGGHVTPGCT